MQNFFRTLHDMGMGYVMEIEDNNWCKEVTKINVLLLPWEIWLDSSLTKYQYDLIYRLYYRRSEFLLYQVRLYVCINVCMCISFPFTSTLGGGDVKGVLHNSSTQPWASPRFNCYTMFYYITLLKYSSRHITWTILPAH